MKFGCSKKIEKKIMKKNTLQMRIELQIIAIDGYSCGANVPGSKLRKYIIAAKV